MHDTYPDRQPNEAYENKGYIPQKDILGISGIRESPILVHLEVPGDRRHEGEYGRHPRIRRKKFDECHKDRRIDDHAGETDKAETQKLEPISVLEII